MSEQTQRRIETGADIAWDTGAVVAVAGVVIVPDVLVSGLDEALGARTFRLVRDDGRWVAVYRDPKDAA